MFEKIVAGRQLFKRDGINGTIRNARMLYLTEAFLQEFNISRGDRVDLYWDNDEGVIALSFTEDGGYMLTKQGVSLTGLINHSGHPLEFFQGGYKVSEKRVKGLGDVFIMDKAITKGFINKAKY